MPTSKKSAPKKVPAPKKPAAKKTSPKRAPWGRVGVVGLGVMGASLARNFASRGIATLAYNRSPEAANRLLADHGGPSLRAARTLPDLVAGLIAPRVVVLMVSAGAPVDAVLADLVPLLGRGDVVVDGGNSWYRDTDRRTKTAAASGVTFVGMGVSGGEEGALKGPSIMPGCSPEAWDVLRPLLEPVAARDFSGGPCVARVGSGGAGHYVKMVHNGVEYALMQAMAEAYGLLRDGYGLKAPQIADAFARLGSGRLKSFLFDLAEPVLRTRDPLKKGAFLLDAVVDAAGQKGTGKWTVTDALDRGVPVPSVAQAVAARQVSALRPLRQRLAKAYAASGASPAMPLPEFLGVLEDALLAATLSIYSQGYALISKASQDEGWGVDLAEVSRIWQGGCIIRADLLRTFASAFRAFPEAHLLEIPQVGSQAVSALVGARRFLGACAGMPQWPSCLALSVGHVTELLAARGPANFLQGLRDSFGAHTFERLDRPGTFHETWGA